jgi:hypothetical protein
VADPGSMYQLLVDEVHIDNQRDKDHDDDEMAICAMIVGGQNFGSANYGVGSLTDAISGAGIVGFAVGQDHDLTKAWWTGQIDDDLVGLATKLSDLIEGAVIGGFVAEIAALVLGLFGTDRTCVGPVFEKVFVVPAHQLDALVAAGPTTSDTGSNLSIHDGCGASPHTHLTYRWIRRTDLASQPGAPLQGGGLPQQVITTAPRVTARPSDWTGRYATSASIDTADVALELTAASPDPARTLSATSAPLPATDHSPAQLFNLARVHVQLTDRYQRASPITIDETQIAVTQQSGPFTVNTPPLTMMPGHPPFHISPASDPPRLPSATISAVTAEAAPNRAEPAATPHLPPVVPGFTIGPDIPTVLRYAQTLVLSDNSILQPYGYASDGRWIENRIRYQRPATNHRTASDVMLIPTQPRARSRGASTVRQMSSPWPCANRRSAVSNGVSVRLPRWHLPALHLVDGSGPPSRVHTSGPVRVARVVLGSTMRLAASQSDGIPYRLVRSSR